MTSGGGPATASRLSRVRQLSPAAPERGQQLGRVGLETAVVLEGNGALERLAGLAGAPDPCASLPDVAPRPRVGRHQFGVVAQMRVGLSRTPGIEQRVAEAVVGHRVAALEAESPGCDRIVALFLAQCPLEVETVQ